jgi:hypothetical protein
MELVRLAGIDVGQAIGHIPTTHQIKVYYANNIATLEQQARDLRTQILNIPANRQIQVEFSQVGTPTGYVTNPHSGRTTKVPSPTNPHGAHAAGTRHAWAGWSWVGEKGPELMKMTGGEQVKSNSDSWNYVADQLGNVAKGISASQAGGGHGVNIENLVVQTDAPTMWGQTRDVVNGIARAAKRS